VRRSKPTLLCWHKYAATASTSLSIKRRGGAVWAGWRCGLGGGVGCPACGGSVLKLVWVYISNA
jgi:hypothetical protein